MSVEGNLNDGLFATIVWSVEISLTACTSSNSFSSNNGTSSINDKALFA